MSSIGERTLGLHGKNVNRRGAAMVSQAMSESSPQESRSNPPVPSALAAAGVSLVATVGLPIVYLIGRVHEWPGFWPLSSREHLKWPGAALVLGLLLLFLLLLAWVPFRGAVPSEVAPFKRPARSRILWFALLLVVPIWGLLAQRILVLGLPGDGPYWVKLASDPFIMTSEPLGRWSHYIAYQWLALDGEPSKRDAVRLASVAAGCFQLAALVIFSPRIWGSVRRSVPWICYLFVTPLLIFNLGYPETTPWAYALLTASLLAGVSYVCGPMRNPPLLVGVFLALATWVHGAICFTTLGYAYLLVVWLQRGSAQGGIRYGLPRLLRVGGLAVLPFVLLGATLILAGLRETATGEQPLFSNMLGGGDQQRWVALTTPSSPIQYALLSGRYWRDLGNLLISACPVLPLTPLALKALARHNATGSRYLAATLCGALVLTLFWNADYGMRTDFDLLSLFAVPAYLSIAWWLALEVRAYFQAAIVAASSALCTVFVSILPLITLLPSHIPIAQEFFVGTGGEGVHYLGDGWSAPEPWGVWSERADADVTLPVDRGNLPTLVRIQGGGMLVAVHPRQDIDCWINDVFARTITYDASSVPGWEDVLIPAASMESIRKSGKVRLNFKVSDPANPSKLGTGADDRDLGIALRYLMLSRGPEPAPVSSASL